jgi:hypothetical protein
MEGPSEAAMVNTGGLHWQRWAGDPSSFTDWIRGRTLQDEWRKSLLI